MNSKILMILGIVSFAASVLMFVVGSNSSHLTELKDFFWVPLPLGVVLLCLAKKCCGSSCANKPPEPPKSA